MTKFKGTPLFGQDSSPQNTSRILSLCATSAFWLVFLLCMIFIHPAEKTPKYNEVKIILSSTPLEKNESDTIAAQKAESSAQSSDDSNEISNAQNSLTNEKTSSPVEKSPAAPKTSSVVENPTTPKSSTVPTESKTAVKNETSPAIAKNTQPVPPSEPFVSTVKDLSGDIDFGTKKAPSRSDEDYFKQMEKEDILSTQSSDSSTEKKVFADSSATGSAGETASNSNSGSQQSTSSNTATKNTNTSLGTADALTKIRNQNFSGRAENGVESNTNVQAEKSGNGKYLLQMQGGKARLLIEPAEPKINLSKNASDTVSSDIDVTVSFSVTQNGLVSEASVSFTPASVLSEIVKKEIAEQLSKWRFESSDATSYASFEYHIKINSSTMR